MSETSTPPSTPPKLKVDDRVKRTTGKGCSGIVKDVREEVTSSSGGTSEKGLMVVVQWDNGTCSYATPNALEKV